MHVTRQMLLAELPPNREEYVVIARRQDVPDIIQEMCDSYGEFAQYYDCIWQFFERPTLRETCDQLFEFMNTELEYREETKKWQSVAPPFGVLDRGYCDCKGYAGFAGGILGAMARATNRPIDWQYCFASYKKGNKPADKVPYHVFVIVNDIGGPLWIDPTPGASTMDPTWAICERPEIGGTMTVNDMGELVSPQAMVGATGVPGLDTAITIADQVVSLIPGGPLKDELKQLLSGDVLGAISKMINGYKYTGGDYALGEIFLNRVLGKVTSDRWATPDPVIPVAWVYFSTLFGLPVAVNTDFDAIETGSLDAYLSGRQEQRGYVTQDQVSRAKQLLDYLGHRTPTDPQWPPSSFGLLPYVAPIPDARFPGQLFNGTLPNGQQIQNGLPVSDAAAGSNVVVPGATVGPSSGSAVTDGSGFDPKWLLIIGGAVLLFWAMEE